MSSAITETAKYVVFPLLAAAVGAVIGLRNQPSSQVKSLIRHIAAGLVFAAATVELLPNLLKDKQPLATVIGFALGVGLLLTVNVLLGGHHHGDKDETSDHRHRDTEVGSSVLSTFMATIGIDVAVDGLLIGIGFATGVIEGRLLTLALSAEVLFISLSIVASCKDRKLSVGRTFLMAVSPAIIMIVFALIGTSTFAHLYGALHQAVLAFGISALLYLVTEELLVEAHATPDEPVEVAGFFAGFLLILALALL